MYKEQYIGVSITEYLEDLKYITNDHTEAEYLCDETLDAFQIDYEEYQKFVRGEITKEKYEKERAKRNEGRRHSYRLRKAMLDQVEKKPFNTSTHHIVSWDDNRAKRVRVILENVGIDIDDAINGVFLPMYVKHTSHPNMPDAYAHSKIHTEKYYLNIEVLLVNAYMENIGDKDGQRKAVENELLLVAEKLLKGEFPLHERINVNEASYENI